MKFFVVVALLFLVQTLVGGAIAHYRADPGSFYGFDLERIFPSNLMRTWHLQMAIFWIATAYVAAALFLGALAARRRAALVRALGASAVRARSRWSSAAACSANGSGISAMAAATGGSGSATRAGNIWSSAGSGSTCSWSGLLVWFAMLWSLARPRDAGEPGGAAAVSVFLFAALAIPVFYMPALFFGAKTNYTVVDTWRFWIIHLWVEGFFEFFATMVVALTFYQLGLTRRNVALRVIYLDAHPVLRRRPDRHRASLVFHRPDQFQHGAVGDVLGAGSGAADPADAGCLGLRRTTRGDCDICGKAIAIPHKWTFYFLMAVGFWNFVGAGMFGFLINLPIVSYYEIGTLLTPNHGHAAMMGVFGMLAIALMVFVLRQTSDDARWPGIEKYVKVGFWGTNIGLAMMVVLSLFPGGVLQVWDVLQNGYWHARSLDYIGSTASR